MLLHSAFAVAVFAAAALAQNTWVVNAGGGTGVHFLDLPTAVASPVVVDGDTIVVQPGPFGEGATPFVTSKGLTIVGAGGQVPIYTLAGLPLAIVGLPAGRTFRLVGFTRPTDGELNLFVQGCAGEVHLEDLHARSPGMVFPPWPGIVVDQCASVTMRDVENFGTPAVQVNQSTVTLVSCRLGVTSIGVGGGMGLSVTGSTVHVVQPWFEPAWSPVAISATDSDVRIAGDGAARVSGGQYSATSVPIATAGTTTVTIDPAVPTPTFPPGGPAVVGTAVPAYVVVPASWTGAAAVAGQNLTIATRAGAGAVVFQALGAPGPLAGTAFGLLGVDPGSPFAFFPLVVAPAGGVVGNQVAVPATIARGTAFASQAVVFDGVALAFGAPVTFVVR